MNAAPRSSHRSTTGLDRIVLGLAVIAFGTLALLDNLHTFATPLLRDYWPLGLVLWGASRLLAPRHPGRWVFACALIAAGLLLTAHNLGLVTGRPEQWWPLAIILGGISLLTRDRRSDAAPAGTVDSGERVEISTRFGSVSRRVDATQFRGGRIDTQFSSVELDLSQARMAGPEATLELAASFSSVELLIPRDWQLDLQVQTRIGGIEDRTQPVQPTVGRLILRGVSDCGSIQIRH
ncbi:MAG: hypothetical protein DI603_06445 [Roseateles depolymerans]|uniref:LiaF transmembrane domain-containing protein n=1 Tax=Roseateles depolymerans TaxID=76731 RepID=A0A2W5FNN5_9BURK|nr:MAG: hypothetical protein DI603_06445 [Roseateles depolymerans]